jgi:hypothetical protein
MLSTRNWLISCPCSFTLRAPQAARRKITAVNCGGQISAITSLRDGFPHTEGDPRAPRGGSRTWANGVTRMRDFSFPPRSRVYNCSSRRWPGEHNNWRLQNQMADHRATWAMITEGAPIPPKKGHGSDLCGAELLRGGDRRAAREAMLLWAELCAVEENASHAA